MAGRKGKKTIFKYIQKDPPPGDSEGLWLDTNWNVVRKWIPLDDDDPNNTGLWRAFGERYGRGSDYGYICGGYDGTDGTTEVSTIDRITFPFDSGTASNVGNLSGSRRNTSANNSSTHSYICGGLDGTNFLSIIDRITFPFDSGISLNVGNLSGNRRLLGSCNSSIHGYICGGDDGTNELSIIDRITFPFDSGTANNVGNISYNTDYNSANNSSTHGYICGGTDGTNNHSTIDRITFPFDSGTASNVGNMSYIYTVGNKANNSSTYGYLYSGYSGGEGDYNSYIDRFQFPFDSGTASNIGNLSIIRRSASANNSSTHGYICGGTDGTNNHSTIDRITFPFDSGTASIVGNLSRSKGSLSATDGTDFVTQFPSI